MAVKKSILKKESSASSCTTTTTTTTPKKNVEFNTITVYEFPMVLGDNPACSCGIPIQIGWKPQHMSCRNFELYEVMREPARRGRPIRLKDTYRAQLLLGDGYKMDHLVKATMQVEEIRESRRESLKQQGWGKFVETLETTGQLPVHVMKGVLGKTGGIMAATGGMLVAGGAAVVNGSAIGARTVVNTGAAVVNTGAGMVTMTVSVTGGAIMATGKTLVKVMNPMPRAKSLTPATAAV